MELFTMKYENQKHRMALEMLGAERGSAEIRFCCVAHRKDEASGELKPEALLLGGSVPVKELTRWAARKGFLKWQRKDLTAKDAKSAKADAKPAEKKPAPKKPATKKATAKTKPTAQKKEKKNARSTAKRSTSKSVSRTTRRR